MLTTGSKLLIGGTVVAFALALAYGVTQEGTLGVVGLVSAGAGLGLLAGINVALRDSNVSATDSAASAMCAAGRRAPAPSLWPLVVAGGGGLITLGVVTQQAFVLFGVALLVLGAVQWMLDAWSERASADVEFNVEARERLAAPLELPVLAAIAAAVVVFSFSRIMLVISKTAGPVAFGVIAALVLAGGFVFAFARNIRSSAIAAVTAVGALGLVAGGVAAGLEGERPLHPHETTGDLRAESACDTTEETEADENASQTVGNKANVAAEITLSGDERLSARPPGLPASQRMIVGRGNAANVIFRNESPEPRRLVLTTGSKPALDEQGEEIEGERVPDQRCTALAEEGGAQLLTFEINKPSATSEDPFRFTVPGVDGQAIEVVVP